MTKSVLIVGGGTAGWMTASYLAKVFPKLRITVLESDIIPTIGVGEATFSTIKVFFDFLGLPESEWMPHCNATYKLAIKFANWGPEPGHFYHPFQRYATIDGFNAGEWWLRLKPGQQFDRSCFVTPALCEAKLSPCFLDGRVFDEKVQDLFADPRRKASVLSEHKEQYPYGYHFDAALFAKYLRDYATKLGVKQILDDVINVELADDGSIDHVIGKISERVSADLFVDCTGFRGLLLNEALQEPFISFKDSLLNDRAVALRVPSTPDTDEIEPFTTATTMSAGWTWNIPLYNRIGTGYVYSSQFITPEMAESELRNHVGSRAENCSANHIKMRIGRSRNSWVKNCIGIGLTSGFVEPLESTGIFFIQHNIEELVAHFPGENIDPDVVASFNRIVGSCIDGVRDFLVLHFKGSGRNDTPFWKAVKQTPLPDHLEERFQLWRKRLPNAKSIDSRYHGFEYYSYSVMMLGLGSAPTEYLPTLAQRDPTNAIISFNQVNEQSQKLVSTLPSHREYIMQLYSTAPHSERHK
ncbi:MAG: tryptophan 7-halogenase [Mesorhizobium sp.]|uniref:tryptophan halogenase family protein n=1 Tax=Mesorhizobium TaxID=68287 RepID=UPI000FE7857B|nr:tryptophan halogenase family protein [Mesorhizobium sp.]RWG43560.1 MAG: tryptophan 7-halogenase [Mesorhizobium sp.]RWK99950.1 MAG: tryptophan 7-halogenase [Mesorhizobium sp.]TIN10185.1 MAG: tryptophan 7-halogenase [Mesorhizobium sp.]TIQ61622.1 MAG: tryptophan 7-halogenase [Mesorhizobium sp.]